MVKCNATVLFCTQPEDTHIIHFEYPSQANKSKFVSKQNMTQKHQFISCQVDTERKNSIDSRMQVFYQNVVTNTLSRTISL